jgi:putative methyltransferase
MPSNTINQHKSACMVYVQVKGVILDPSCSGSGTTVSRMDHLLPSSTAGPSSSGLDEQEQQRVEQLAKFQVS